MAQKTQVMPRDIRNTARLPAETGHSSHARGPVISVRFASMMQYCSNASLTSRVEHFYSGSENGSGVGCSLPFFSGTCTSNSLTCPSFTSTSISGVMSSE